MIILITHCKKELSGICRWLFVVFAGLGIFYAGAALAASAMYQRCEPGTDCQVGEFIFENDDHTPITTDNYCQISITDPNDSVVANAVNMSHKSDGWHYYTVNIATPTGAYRATMCCDSGASRRCIDKTFVLGTSLDTVATKSDLTALVSNIWSYGSRTLTSFGSLASEVWNTLSNSLTTPGTIGNQLAANLDTSISSRASQTSVDAVRASQQKQWQVYLTQSPDVATGNTYRVKLWILNYESTPTDAVSAPTIVLYDAGRNKVVENVAMTEISAGIYEYTYNVVPTAIQGIWETKASAVVESGKTIDTSSYWRVTGSPAQVRINNMTSVAIPSVSANTTITNEGGVAYEYHYEWCVVSSPDNACGGNDDVFYSSASKFIQPGQDWTTDLAATVPTAGDYWFKVIVRYGTEQSGSSQSFTAVKQNSGGGGGGGGSSSSGPVKDIAGQIKGAFCSVFPCDVINRMLARLDASESGIFNLTKKVDTLMASLKNSSISSPTSSATGQGVSAAGKSGAQSASLLNAAPPQVIIENHYYQTPSPGPQRTLPKTRARISLEMQ